MSVLKQYNEATSAWEPVVIGKQGNSGTIAVQSPLTNSGTANAAVLGLDANAFSYGQNLFINGGMDIWQRGTSVTNITDAVYGPDRWLVTPEAGAVASGVKQSNVVVPGLGIMSTLKYTFTTAPTYSGSNLFYKMGADEINSSLAGKTSVLSFYARANRNKTAFPVLFFFPSGTSASQATFNLTTEWQRFTVVITVPSNVVATQVGFFQVLRDNDATTTAGDWWEFTGAQLENGSVATPFKRHGGSVQMELSACQRYYWRNSSSASANYKRFATGQFVNSTTFLFVTQMPVTMRATPSINVVGTFSTRQGDTQLGTTIPGLVSDGSDSNSVAFHAAVSGANAGYGGYIRSENSSTTYIEFNAEV